MSKLAGAIGCVALLCLLPTCLCSPFMGAGSRTRVEQVATPEPEQPTQPERQVYTPPPSQPYIDPYASNAPKQPHYGQEQQAERTVYITNSGSKYHSGGCRYLRRSAIPMSLSQAQRMYSACSVCGG